MTDENQTHSSPQTTGNPETDRVKQLEQQVADLTSKVGELETKAANNWDQALRARAEMENVRRRTQKDLESAHKFALERFVQELLPIVDSMELGLAASANESQDVSKFREGSELTLKMLISGLEKFNVKQLNPTGEKFNPDQQQAISMQPSPDVDPNTVLSVVQKGYLLHDRLIRPALVVVSKAVSGSSINETA